MELKLDTIQKRQRIADLKAELERLNQQVSQEERACNHVWDKPVYDPIVTPHMEFSHYEGQGSDPNPVYRRCGDDSKPRWTKTCSKCGAVRSTTRTKVTATAPDF